MMNYGFRRNHFKETKGSELSNRMRPREEETTYLRCVSSKIQDTLLKLPRNILVLLNKSYNLLKIGTETQSLLTSNFVSLGLNVSLNGNS
jgi:hypothetical protein